MPWGVMSVSDLRLEFCLLASGQGRNVRELCRRFGVSAKTGYKWLGRFKAGGRSALLDRSKRPKLSPKRSAPGLEAAAIEVRNQHPAWGGRKIAHVLARAGGPAPSPSTVTAILRRHGCEIGAHGGGAAPFQRFEREAPNELWQMDFKGHVAMADGRRLHPLTILDDHSRYCLALGACHDERTATVLGHLIEAFRRYGLPQTLICDNGSPWGDGPDAPFTPLGVFLIDQGIRIAHSRPYHPQTMGKDERFHRSLKAEALSGPLLSDLAAAASRLARWRTVYNHQRPHEGIGMATPASRYAASQRSFKERIEPFDYAPSDILRRLGDGGVLSMSGRRRRAPKAFKGRIVALRPSETDGLFEVFYRHQRIARLDFKSETGDAEPVTHVSERLSPICPV